MYIINKNEGKKRYEEIIDKLIDKIVNLKNKKNEKNK